VFLFLTYSFFSVKANDGVVDDKTLIKQYRATINVSDVTPSFSVFFTDDLFSFQDLRTQIEEFSAGKYLNSTNSLDPDSALGQAIQQKTDLENRIRGLETLLLSKGATANEIATILQTSSLLSQNNNTTKTMELEAELIKLNEKMSEQTKLITKLQRTLNEYSDLEESKANFEEYEHHIRQELDEETTKLEEEKLTLQNERYKLLKDRSNIDEKESRIGLLLTNLDEKESKLRQLLANMKEQQDQWSRSITDLQKREDLVDDWQRNHKTREKKLLEIETLQEKKFLELNKRESFIAEEENRLKNFNKELSEREQRLQIGLSRVNNQESANNQKEETLNLQETSLKKKEHESDIRERELLSRRKELESWDVLLREKDRKIMSELKTLDFRELSIKTVEDKIKSRELEIENKVIELNKSEISYQEMMAKYTSLITENEEINKEIRSKSSEYDFLLKDLNSREEELKKWEKSLFKLQDYLKNIESREKNLIKSEQSFSEKENEFYNVKIAQISSRHNHELKSLEEIIQKQLKITTDFQKELNDLRNELSAKMETIHELETIIEQKNSLIDHLKDQLTGLETGVTSNQLRNSINNGSPSIASSVADASNPNPNSISPTDNISQSNRENSHNDQVLHTPKTSQQQTNPFEAKNSARAANFNNYDNMMQQPAGNLHPHNFLSQLAITRNILYQVLEKYDAIPDPNVSNKFVEFFFLLLFIFFLIRCQ
jgi:chromosome segregation ATPase